MLDSILWQLEYNGMQDDDGDENTQAISQDIYSTAMHDRKTWGNTIEYTANTAFWLYSQWCGIKNCPKFPLTLPSQILL